MKVLVLAPQPFYQERGTPIAVNLLLAALSERGDSVDLLAFHEGEDVSHPGVRIHRAKPFPAVSGVKPGFSAKKLHCDAALFGRFVSMVIEERYDVVHAIEEAAFMALVVCRLRGIPFVYDMDSSMSDQLVDKMPRLRGFRGLLRACEARAIRSATCVVPMCDALASVAREEGARRVRVLKDVSLVGRDPRVPQRERSASREPTEPAVDDLRALTGAPGPIVLYIGNLESYQGIDLLLDAFVVALRTGSDPPPTLVVIGGAPADVARYRGLTEVMGIAERARFVGPRPVSHLDGYLSQADVLVSPRTQGTNTPMKVYSYLDSGVAVLATDLPTHTQVMTPEIAALAPPDDGAFGEALAVLLADPDRQRALAERAREHVRREHSYEAYRSEVHALYDELESARRGPALTGPPER